MAIYALANMAWQLGGDRALLLELAQHADVLALVEARTHSNEPIDVRAVLPGWHVAQDTRTAARAGSVLAVRRGGPVELLRWDTQLASHAGKNVQTRYRVQGTIRRLERPRGRRRATLAVQHNPILSSGRQDDAIRNAARWAQAQRDRHLIRPFALAGDLNTDPQRMRRELGVQNQCGADVMAWLWSRGWGQVDCTAVGHTSLRGKVKKFTDHGVLVWVA